MPDQHDFPHLLCEEAMFLRENAKMIFQIFFEMIS